MLVITRKLNESIIIGDGIEVTVLEVSKDKIKLGINAPQEVRVKRKEIIATEETNKMASLSVPNDFMKMIVNKKKGSADNVSK